jgi:hypothetical protein
MNDGTTNLEDHQQFHQPRTLAALLCLSQLHTRLRLEIDPATEWTTHFFVYKFIHHPFLRNLLIFNLLVLFNYY